MDYYVTVVREAYYRTTYCENATPGSQCAIEEEMCPQPQGSLSEVVLILMSTWPSAYRFLCARAFKERIISIVE